MHPNLLINDYANKEELIKERNINSQEKLENCSTSSAIIKKKQIKTPLGFYLTPSKMTIIKRINCNKCWQRFVSGEE